MQELRHALVLRFLILLLVCAVLYVITFTPSFISSPEGAHLSPNTCKPPFMFLHLLLSCPSSYCISHAIIKFRMTVLINYNLYLAARFFPRAECSESIRPLGPLFAYLRIRNSLIRRMSAPSFASSPQCAFTLTKKARVADPAAIICRSISMAAARISASLGQRALKQAQEWQTVLELAQPKRQDTHNAPSCPLSKFITTEASQGGVIALTTTRITRQHDIVSFSQAPACRQIWSDGSWTGKEIEPAWENYYESQGYKPTATCKECGLKKLCVLTSLTPTEVLPSPPSPPPSWCCLKCVSPECCVRARGRRPEPTMTNWGNASKICASIPQDTADHNRRELIAFCQGCWYCIDFRHNTGTIAALELTSKLKIDAHRTASGTQGMFRGALTSQEISKYLEHCL